MSNTSDETSFTTLTDRIQLCLATASGLIVVGCLGGLPTATCTALAMTYSNAIHDFGGSALACLLSLLFGKFTIGKNAKRLVIAQSHDQKFALILVIAMATVFFWSASSASQNLKTAMNHCYIGSEAEIQAHIHDVIPLGGPSAFKARL